MSAPTAYSVAHGGALLWWRAARGAIHFGAPAALATAALLPSLLRAPPLTLAPAACVAAVILLWQAASIALKAASLGGLPSGGALPRSPLAFAATATAGAERVRRHCARKTMPMPPCRGASFEGVRSDHEMDGARRNALSLRPSGDDERGATVARG